MSNQKEIIPDNITELKNITFVDVRTPEEYAEGTYGNAINIPMQETEVRINDYKSLSDPIVVFCKKGGRADSVKTFLKNNGITVYNGINQEYLRQTLG